MSSSSDAVPRRGAVAGASEAASSDRREEVAPERSGEAPGGRGDGASPRASDLAAALPELMLRDERRLGRRLDRARRLPASRRSRELGAIAREIDRAGGRVAARIAAVPVLRYPAELPVSERVADLAAAIRDHQVVVVAGETGSGKSTQLPKICLGIGRGVRGAIAHTQPRRIAARALAERIAEETGTQLGAAVGYTIRFGDHTSPSTLVRLMTDGILLAQIANDPDLLAYDTVIIDEAHERSLNIDFLLGYLARLLPRRPDLKLIITSATIDPAKFSAHFGGAPIVEVSGRTYPVQIRYRPYGPVEADSADAADAGDAGEDVATGEIGEPANRVTGRGPTADGEPIDQATAICRAVDELGREGPGDVLVFLSGEREITDTAEVLRAHLAQRSATTEVLPLYGRLSMADQHRVFSAHTGRRIVLATNVAETSLTVPGIHYVIDPGTARISRYSPRTKVQRLPIERVSQASAGQRAGRCGRVADGICIRLYSERDFADRPPFTDPEIARTSLASVILQMAALDLGEIATFPFIDPPDPRQVTDGLTVLGELGAIDASASPGRTLLTDVGRSLARLPVDPRLARMLVEADRLGCLAEVLVIVAALAIQDVREYPLDDRDRAVAAHSRFADRSSDFLAILNLWGYLIEQAKALSGNGFRRMCRSEYLHYLRIREWQDLHGQLSTIASDLGMAVRSSAAVPDPAAGVADPEAAAPGRRRSGRSGGRVPAARPDTTRAHATQQGRGSAAVGVDRAMVHTALLSGLLSHIGTRLEPGREYQGARGTRFAIWPGSALARGKAGLVVAAELVETTRLWGRLVASVDPAWVEQVGGDLLRRSHSEPRWDARRGAVLASERVTLLGVTLVAARTVQFDRIDPVVARELFLRHALVEGDVEVPPAFLSANQATLDRAAEHERRARRQGVVIDDDALYALYDARIPAEVTSLRHLESWWRKASRTDPGRLTFTEDMLIAAGAALASAEEFPDEFMSGDVRVELDYVFDPGAEDDGVSATVPLAALPRLDPSAFARQIPGLRRDLAVALIRSLPKALRRAFVPAPDFADAALARMAGASGRPLPEDLAAALRDLTGIDLTASSFDMTKVPPHLTMTVRVVDETGAELARGKDVAAIQRSLRVDARRAVARVARSVEASGLTTYPVAGVPRTVGSAAGPPGQVPGGPVSQGPPTGDSMPLGQGPDPRAAEPDESLILGHPALVDEGATVGIRVFTSPSDQARAMRAGTRRLLVLAAGQIRTALRSVVRAGSRSALPGRPGSVAALSRDDVLVLATVPGQGADGVLDDAMTAAVDALLDWAGGPTWTADGFDALRERVFGHLEAATVDVLRAAAGCLREAAAASSAIDPLGSAPAFVAAVADMRAELAGWMRPGFLTRVGAGHLPDLQRYLRAVAVRAERVRESPDRDRARMAEIVALSSEIDRRVSGLRPERAADPDVGHLRRLVAEYRVAVFAQPMRTGEPVSPKRIRAALAALPD
jgi:ATP-dependent helicase HrpA